MRKRAWWALVVLASLGVGLLGIEALYRWQLVDTYAPEMRALNPPDVLASTAKPTLLVMGDSFTASRGSYAGILQDTLPNWRVVNAAVSGTGVLQALYMAPHRFGRFRPSTFVYQVYVGNDLFDIRYPTDWRTVSAVRNLYWMVANRLRVVGFVNYRIAQLGRPPAGVAAANADTFSVDRYDARVKIMLRAEPSLLEDSILARRTEYVGFLNRLADLLAYCEPETCRAYVLVIPHVSQVNDASVTHMTELGARFANPAAVRALDYPFLTRLRERFAGSPNIRIVDPLGRLREAEARQPVFNANDEHLNAAGQREIAALLQQQLQSQ